MTLGDAVENAALVPCSVWKLPAVFGLLLVLLVSTGCGQATVRQSASAPVPIAVQATTDQHVVAEPAQAEPAVEQLATTPQPLLFADDRPEPYRPRGPPGLTFLPFFPAPLLLPADVVMPSELCVVVERVVRGNVVVAWAAVSPVGWRVGWLAGPQAVGFRYYNPVTGRYISRDPIGFVSGTMNLYGYVRNNPINRIDPLGLEEEDGHHVVPQRTWDQDKADKPGEKLKPGVREIYGKARLRDDDYTDHNTRKVPVGDPEGVSAHKYNDAVRAYSEEKFGKLPHELDKKQAQKLVDGIMALTNGEPGKKATDAEKTISKYNKAINAEIKAAKAEARARRVTGERRLNVALAFLGALQGIPDKHKSSAAAKEARTSLGNWARNVMQGNDTTANYADVTAALEMAGMTNEIGLSQAVKSLHQAEEQFNAPIPDED